uniref:energy-coupled thiamine transporter ThiT n=1 Tax=Ndongobacter massiliensis TaxID=1871025 RepID=UPI0009F80B3C|nr:energy-coupled thiamine transporter ThiT [Ndongobacter massiliensis]
MMKKNSFFSAQMLAEAGLMIALAKVLSMIKLFEAPYGGSVTLGSMAPLFIFAVRWGWKRGLLVGMVYGFVDLMIGGYIIHPLQLVLDYPLAYMMCGFAGLRTVRSEERFLSFLPPIFLAVALRFVCHVLSGCIFFGAIDFTKPGATLAEALVPANFFSGLSYSVLYNLGYLSFDFIICVALMGLLWQPIRRALIQKAN